MKYHIVATRGPMEPGSLALSITLELDLEDKLASVELGDELAERVTIAVAATTAALNRQFPTRGLNAPPADLAVEDGDESYHTATPVPVPPPREPFSEFNGNGNGAIPPRPGPPPAPQAEPAIPPRPGRVDPPRRTGIVDKPPRNASELLGWLKDRPEEKKYATQVGKAWDYGSFIKQWNDDQAVSVYNEVSRKFHANGFAHANGNR